MDKKQVVSLALCFSPLIAAAVYPGRGAYIGFLIAILIVALNKAARAIVLRLLDQSWTRTIALGVLGGIAIDILGRILGWALRVGLGLESDLGASTEMVGDLSSYLLFLVYAIIVGGILEELTFRGVIVGWGTALLGERAKVWLVLLSATVFGLSHSYQGVAGMITTGTVGALIGFLYLYADRKLLVPIVAHSTINIIGVTSLFLANG